MDLGSGFGVDWIGLFWFYLSRFLYKRCGKFVKVIRTKIAYVVISGTAFAKYANLFQGPFVTIDDSSR